MVVVGVLVEVRVGSGGGEEGGGGGEGWWWWNSEYWVFFCLAQRLYDSLFNFEGSICHNCSNVFHLPSQIIIAFFNKMFLVTL